MCGHSEHSLLSHGKERPGKGLRPPVSTSGSVRQKPSAAIGTHSGQELSCLHWDPAALRRARERGVLRVSPEGAGAAGPAGREASLVHEHRVR